MYRTSLNDKKEIIIPRYHALFLLGVLSVGNRESKILRDIEKSLWKKLGY